MAGESVFNPSQVDPADRRALEDLIRRLRLLEAELNTQVTGGSQSDRAYTDQQDANHSLEDRQYAETLLDNRMYGPTGLDLAALVAAANALIGTDIGAIENPDMFASDLIVARHLLAGSVTGESIRATGSITTGGTGSRIQIIGSDNPATTSIRSMAGPPMQLNAPHGDWNGTGVPTPTPRTKLTAGVLFEDKVGHGLEVVGVRLVDYADSVAGWIQFPFTSGAVTFVADDLDTLAPHAEWFTASTGQEVALVHGETLVVDGPNLITFNGSLVSIGALV
jgi:hypothetical protein